MSWLKHSHGAQASEESSLLHGWDGFFRNKTTCLYRVLQQQHLNLSTSSIIQVMADLGLSLTAFLILNVEVFIRKWCNVNIWWPKGISLGSDLQILQVLASKEYISVKAGLRNCLTMQNVALKVSMGPRWSTEFELYAVLSVNEVLDSDWVRYPSVASLLQSWSRFCLSLLHICGISCA